MDTYLTQQGSSVPSELIQSDGSAKLANDQISSMESSDNFNSDVTTEQAMELASNGAVVIAGQTGADHGHIDVVGSGKSQPTSN